MNNSYSLVKRALVAALFVGCFVCVSHAQVSKDDPANYDSDKQNGVIKAQAAEAEEIAKAKALSDKIENAMNHNGYLKVPGFNLCGDCSRKQNDARYAAALENLKRSNFPEYLKLTGQTN